MLDSNREKWKSLGQKLVEVLGIEAVLMSDRKVTERHKAESKEYCWKLFWQAPGITRGRMMR